MTEPPSTANATSELLTTALAIADLGTWQHDLRTGLTRGDQRWRALSGLHEDVPRTSDEILTRVHPDDRERVRRALATAFEPDRPDTLDLEYRVQAPAEPLRWIAVRGRPVSDGLVVGTVRDLTERETQSLRLRDLEAFHRQTIASVPDMTFVTNAAGECEYVSPQWSHYTGTSDDRLRGQGWLHALHPDDRPRLQAAWRAAVARSSRYDVEARVRRRDGQYEWFKIRGQALQDARGVVARWFGTLLNVDDFKHAESRLAGSEERLQLATARAHVGIWESDLVAGRGYWSDEAVRLAGTSRREFTSADWLDAIHPDDRDRVAAAWERALSQGAPFEVRFRAAVPASDGGERWLLSRGAVLRDPGGAPRRGAGVLLDVTAETRAELRLRRSEERFRAATAASSDILWTNDPSGRMTGPQPGWSAYTGQSAAEYEGLGWSRALHPDDVAPTIEAWREAVATGTKFVFEHRVRRHDGVYRTFAIRALPVKEPDGSVREWVGVHTDVTDVRAAAQALRDADRRKDEFLATLSHELRNPLAPIRTAAAMLGHERLESGQVTWARKVIQRQVNQLVRLLDDLLDVSRITQGKLVLKRAAVSVDAIVEAAVEATRPLMDAKKHRLELALARDLPPLDGDPARLAQVLSNLLNNAAKYTPAGGRIALTVTANRSEIALEVADEGIGIAADDLPRLFQTFTQLDGGRESPEGGLGLGLAIVKSLVEMHGGRVTADSAGPGRGSVFRVHLPVAEAVDAAAAEARRVTGAGGVRVLVVDDNRDAADALALALAMEGFEVRVAHGGGAGLLEARDFAPHVAFVDLGMPDVDGFDFASAVHSARVRPRLRLVALTGRAQDVDKHRARDAGFERHLTKPVDLEDVLGVLADLAPTAHDRERQGGC